MGGSVRVMESRVVFGVPAVVLGTVGVAAAGVLWVVAGAWRGVRDAAEVSVVREVDVGAAMRAQVMADHAAAVSAMEAIGETELELLEAATREYVLLLMVEEAGRGWGGDAELVRMQTVTAARAEAVFGALEELRLVPKVRVLEEKVRALATGLGRLAGLVDDPGRRDVLLVEAARVELLAQDVGVMRKALEARGAVVAREFFRPRVREVLEGVLEKLKG